MASKLHLTLLLLYLYVTIAINHHHKHKKIIQLSAEPDAFTHQYGVELPSFAYDSSEYFISAMVERATDSYSLHVTMFLLGHNTIATDLPFESISTEEEIIYKWGHALKVFKPYRNVTSSHSSGLMCVIKNNDPKHPTPYHVPAFWVPTDSLPNEFKGNLEILRCQLKDVVSAYHQLAARETSLYIDVVRKGSHHHQGAENSENSTFLHDQSSAIISFSVPWKSRYNGYGMKINFNYSAHDPWMSHRPHQPLHKETLVENANTKMINTPIIYACAASAKAIDSKDSSFIESILESGVKHVFLGVLLDIRSNRIAQYKKFFNSYIATGQLSLVPLALEGFDHVAGFDGLHIHEKYGNWLFYNQCLYYTKGVADFTFIYEPDEHLLNAGGGSNSLHDRLRLYYPTYYNTSTAISPSLRHRSNSSLAVLRHRVVTAPDLSYCYLKFGSVTLTKTNLLPLTVTSILLHTSKVWIATKTKASCQPSGHRVIAYNSSHVAIPLSEAAIYKSGHHEVNDKMNEVKSSVASRYKQSIQALESRNARFTDDFTPVLDSKIVLGSRDTMKSPFWQNCDVNHLDNVLKRVFNV